MSLPPKPVAGLSTDERRKQHATLWIAVGITAVVIAALWAMTLPLQFSRIAGGQDSTVSRWFVAGQEDAAAQEPQTFSDVLERQREQLDAIEFENKEQAEQPQQQEQEITVEPDL